MKKRNVKVRLLSILLSTVMLIGMLPVIPITISAAATTDSSQFISLPITIRDFAADGMLFEFNQVGATGTKGIGGGEPTQVFTGAAGGNATSSVKSGYVRYTVSGTGNYITWTLSGETRTSLRYMAIKYRTNATYSEQPTIGHRASDGNHYVNFDTNYDNGWQTAVIDLGSGTATVNYVSLFPRLASGNYIDIAYIAFFSKQADATTYNTNGGVYIPAATYNQADTSGFSLLSTGDADYINSLPSDESKTISGTDLIQNGTWGLKTDPDPIETILNSGAKQQVYGAWIRTDLIESTLGANGKPVYIEAAVDYLAEYMQDIFNVKYQESDGSYNTFYVTGVKLFDKNYNYVGPTSSAVYDLADIFRGNISTDGSDLGSFADAKAKFEAGNLNLPTQATTWYEAAYFLLHNTWLDSTVDANKAGSDGYGMLVSDYKSINLMQTTNSDGETCYVFNSGYDDAKYDYTNGVIYNTQTENITIAKTSSGIESYVRGNALPAARFDPLGISGAGKDMGYGMSGDTYGDMVSESTADWNTYYDNTNYHLSLEGHAQFIYYHDDNLYFTFTGDDDVYLFINGVRVLDLGAAHSISKVKVSLNDVAELCGLEDGKAYNFDFFYMERHGTAANFGIETNIKIVDPSMLTQKTGYQFGAEVGYNGFVNPEAPVNYCFQLTNNGEAPLKQLEFLDNDIGVNITSTALSFNSETTVSDLLLALYAADGTVKKYIPKGSLTEDALKQALDEGIDIGERILIHGFKYTIPSDEWVKENNNSYIYFNNTVYTVGIAHYKNASTEELHGIADYRVQKPSFVFAGDHFYTLGELKDGSKVDLKSNSTITNNVTEAEILEMVNAGQGAVKINLSTFVSIEICSASGNTETNKNNRATVEGKTINYSTPITGTDNFYFIVHTGENDYGPIRVTVYNYGWSDNKYVIDYGLPVELNDIAFGLTANDAVIDGNPYIASTTLSPFDLVETYGSFNISEISSENLFGDKSIKYVMSSFMSGVDSMSATVTLAEDGVTVPDNRTNGVVFTEKVEIAPASVMYYEDDFAGINYVNGEVSWEAPVPGSGADQSADQNSNYGSDPHYADSSDVSSDGSIHQMILPAGTKNREILYFDFEGTGLELISRATQRNYSILNVVVFEWNADGTAPELKESGIYYNTPIKKFVSVINESEGGDAYEVPVVKIDDLEYGKYRVAVYAANSNASGDSNPLFDNGQREVYIDGIRIYNPLTDAVAKNYYSADEFGASFEEIRPHILGINADNKTKIVYTNVTDSNITWAIGSTVVEDIGDDNSGSTFQVSDKKIDEYLKWGPNNEIYLDAFANGDGNNFSLLQFYVKKTDGLSDSERTLQIGAHRKIDTNTVTSNGADVIENGSVYLAFGSTAADLADGIQDASGRTLNYVEISSGTEQYISIDPACLSFDSDGVALVLVGTFGGENAGSNILAFTNLKIKGYELQACQIEIESVSSDSPMFATALSLRSMMAVSEEVEPETPEIPEIPGFPGYSELPKNPVLPDKNAEKDTHPEIFSAVTLYNTVMSGSKAIITIEATGNTESLLILDENNNEIDFRVLSVRKYTDLLHFFTAVYSGRWDKLPEEKAIYIIELYIEESDSTEKTYSVYAINDQEEISAESRQVNIRVIASKSYGKNKNGRR